MTTPRLGQDTAPPPLPGDAPDNDGPPSSPLNPGSMHRAERDAEAAATTPEFNERPVTDSYTAARATADPRSVHPVPSDPMADGRSDEVTGRRRDG